MKRDIKTRITDQEIDRSFWASLKADKFYLGLDPGSTVSLDTETSTTQVIVYKDGVRQTYYYAPKHNS